MHLGVINGSPKGYESITLQYIKYMADKDKGIDIRVINAGKDINKFEGDNKLFDIAIDTLSSSDGIIWAFPVYHMLVPSQLKMFIELIFEKGKSSLFKGKYSASLSTSAHFYDNLAHDYINGISEDMGMKFIDRYSAHMKDLLEERGRIELMNFWNMLIKGIKENAPVMVRYPAISQKIPDISLNALIETPKKFPYKVNLVMENKDRNNNLLQMVNSFIGYAPYNVNIIDLEKFKISGGCKGCLQCAYDGSCIYKDDVKEIFLDRIFTSDAVIFAGNIKDRYLSARMKMFFDRSFFNGHRPIPKNIQAAYILSGPLRSLPNLRQDLEARTEISNMNMAGIVTDEYSDPEYIGLLIKNLSEKIAFNIANNVKRPLTYHGTGGHKVLRDLVYSFQGIFIADDIYYSQKGLYDFPNNNIRERSINSAMKLMLKVPGFRKKFYSNINNSFLKQLRNVQ